MYEETNKRSDIVTHETTYTKSDLHTKHGMKGYAHGGHIHMEGIYTQRGHVYARRDIHMEDMRTEGTYTSRGRKGHNTVGHKHGKAYTQRDIDTKRPTHKATDK